MLKTPLMTKLRMRSHSFVHRPRRAEMTRIKRRRTSPLLTSGAMRHVNMKCRPEIICELSKSRANNSTASLPVHVNYGVGGHLHPAVIIISAMPAANWP